MKTNILIFRSPAREDDQNATLNQPGRLTAHRDLESSSAVGEERGMREEGEVEVWVRVRIRLRNNNFNYALRLQETSLSGV